MTWISITYLVVHCRLNLSKKEHSGGTSVDYEAYNAGTYRPLVTAVRQRCNARRYREGGQRGYQSVARLSLPAGMYIWHCVAAIPEEPWIVELQSTTLLSAPAPAPAGAPATNCSRRAKALPSRPLRTLAITCDNKEFHIREIRSVEHWHSGLRIGFALYHSRFEFSPPLIGFSMSFFMRPPVRSDFTSKTVGHPSDSNSDTQACRQ